nr:uncharacterized protein LOC111840500 isoform X3 [Paramormyrops kingsleyae]
MNSRMDQIANLLEKIKLISEEAAHTLRETANDHGIPSLKMKDLNELLPGECNLQIRTQIMDLINAFLQEQDGQSMESVPAEIMSHFSASEAVSYDPDILASTRENLNKLLPGESNSQLRSHIMGLIDVFLQEQARQSMDSIPADVMKTVPYDPDILRSTTEDLNKLLPGERNYQLRSHIMGLINESLQGQAGQSMESSPADVIKDKPVIIVFMHHCRDLSHMINDNCLTKCQPSSDNKVHSFHCAYHDSVGLLRCQENEQVVNMVRSELLSYADSQAEVPQSSITCTQQDTEQQPMATKNAKTLNITKDSELHRGGPKPVDEGSESEQRMTVSPMEHSTGYSGGLAPEAPQSNVDHTNVDLEEKQMAAQDGKRSHIANDSELLRNVTDPAGEEKELHQQVFVPALEHSTGPCGAVKVHINGKTSNLHDTFMKKLNLQIDQCSRESCSTILVFCPFPCQTGTDKDAAKSRVTETSAVSSPEVSSQFNPSPKKMMYTSLVKIQILVAGETFNTHETFIQKLKLQTELCSAENSNVILVFCPVVSRIGTDMKAAMARVTEDKPAILVFMHHCHNPSHMTNIIVEPCSSNIVQVVHCIFHESVGLLECQENDQAVNMVRSALLRYKSKETDSLQEEHVESHAAVPQSHNGPTKVICTKSAVTVPATEQSTASSEETSSMNKFKQFFQRKPSLTSVKVHVLITGQTFKSHLIFIQKLNLHIEDCSAESSSVILVFCPVVSQIGTDMEAAMARVTEDKPVILVFMHHCHSPSHMTNITVQPSRGNIVQVVHCAYHETTGLLQCQENEQAVTKVEATLKKYK